MVFDVRDRKAIVVTVRKGRLFVESHLSICEGQWIGYAVGRKRTFTQRTRASVRICPQNKTKQRKYFSQFSFRKMIVTNIPLFRREEHHIEHSHWRPVDVVEMYWRWLRQ